MKTFNLSWSPMGTAPKGGGAVRSDDPSWVEPPSILLLFEEGAVASAYWDWYYAIGGGDGNGCTNGAAWVLVGGDLAYHEFGLPIGWMPTPIPDEEEVAELFRASRGDR